MNCINMYLTFSSILLVFIFRNDDTAVVSCIADNNEDEYRELIKNFVDWCWSNFFNASKKKEIIIYFRKKPSNCPCKYLRGGH